MQHTQQCLTNLELTRLTARAYRAQLCAVLHDRHLVDVGSKQALEQPEERFLRGSPKEALPWDHRGLDGIVRPLFTKHGIEHVDIHHADEAVVAENEMTAAARPQNLSAVFFQGDVPVHGRNLMAHHIGGAEAGERFANGDLGDAFLGCVEEEPTDENQPDAGLPISLQKEEPSAGHQAIGHELSARTGDTCRPRMVFRYSPDDGAENSSAIQGKSRNQIEECQSKIDKREPAGKSTKHFDLRK